MTQDFSPKSSANISAKILIQQSFFFKKTIFMEKSKRNCGMGVFFRVIICQR